MTAYYKMVNYKRGKYKPETSERCPKGFRRSLPNSVIGEGGKCVPKEKKGRGRPRTKPLGPAPKPRPVGRPRKATTPKSAPKSAPKSPPKEKRPRGRPRKAPKIIVDSDSNDLINRLMREQRAKDFAPSPRPRRRPGTEDYIDRLMREARLKDAMEQLQN